FQNRSFSRWHQPLASVTTPQDAYPLVSGTDGGGRVGALRCRILRSLESGIDSGGGGCRGGDAVSRPAGLQRYSRSHDGNGGKCPSAALCDIGPGGCTPAFCSGLSGIQRIAAPRLGTRGYSITLRLGDVFGFRIEPGNAD